MTRLASTRRIALWSPSPQHGKTTIANYLVSKHGYRALSFAQPLKNSADMFLASIGVDCETIETFKTNKESYIPEIGKSYRNLLRLFGTEFVRDMLSEDVWVNAMKRKIDKLTREAPETPICVDDFRFYNEYEMLLEAGFVFVRIDRVINGVSLAEFSGRLEALQMEASPDTSSGVHRSDAELRKLRSSAWDWTIVNDGTIGKLYGIIEGVLDCAEVLRDE